jgi:hypothetical protein
MTNKEKLLATKPKLIKETVSDVDVWFKPLSRGMFRQLLEDDNGDEIAVTESACNEDGTAMFTKEEVQALPMPVFRELVTAALRANGVNPKGN